MLDYYPSLVEAAIEFKLYSKKIIAENKGQTFVPTPEDESIVHSNQFRLQKCPVDKFIYCLKHG